MNADPNRFDIVTAGELLAEFVAEQCGQRFDAAGRFQGPFPSGAPAIFASQAARMGARVGYAGCVGSDGFGDLILDRLSADGIDTAAVKRNAGFPTGTAFVRYRDDGDRDFIFNLAHSAAAQLDVDDAQLERLAGCRYFHVMGSSLSSPAAIALIERLATRVRERGGQISFDPNIRAELMADPAARAAVLAHIDDCDIFLPSEADLAWLGSGESEAETVERLLNERRMSLVVLKRAARGSEAFTRDHAPRRVAAYPVDERDPTGAGDCFGGALIAALAAGEPLERALTLASAAGAHAVTRVGPMEGCSDRATLDALIASHGGSR